jgi:hypothetical protein
VAQFVSGDTFEDMIASLTWPCTLPPGWSVEWDTTPADGDNNEWCHVRASSWHPVSSFSWTRFIFRCKKTLNYVSSWTVELCFSNSNLVCNIIYVETLLCKKWCIVVISGPAFVWAMFALPILETKWFSSGLYLRDCRYEPSEVRVKPHLSRLCDGG